MIGRDLGTLGSVSEVSARVGSVLGVDGAGEQRHHCSNIWCTFLIACSWVAQMVYGESLILYVNSLEYA